MALIRWCELNVGLALAFAVPGRRAIAQPRAAGACRQFTKQELPQAHGWQSIGADTHKLSRWLPRCARPAPSPAFRTRPIEDSAIARAVRAGHNLPQGNSPLALAAHELLAATAFCRRRGTRMLRQQSAKTVWRLDSPAERAISCLRRQRSQARILVGRAIRKPTPRNAAVRAENPLPRRCWPCPPQMKSTAVRLGTAPKAPRCSIPVVIK